MLMPQIIPLLTLTLVICVGKSPPIGRTLSSILKEEQIEIEPIHICCEDGECFSGVRLVEESMSSI